MPDRRELADRVRQAFADCGVAKYKRQADKYSNHYLAIANFLLSKPGLDEYKFVRELVDVMKLRGCVFVTPAVCSNRARMEEAAKRIEKGSPLDGENVLTGCRKLVSTYLEGGVFDSVRDILVSPVTNLPSWFRVVESNGDPEVWTYYGVTAQAELAGDRGLSEYVRRVFPLWHERMMNVHRV